MNYFIEYKKAKFTLLKLVCQCYSVSYTKKEADDLKLNYNDRDKPNDLDRYDFVCCDNTKRCLSIWEKLGFENQIYSFHEIWDYTDKLKTEEKKNINYHRESLELKLLCLDTAKDYYKYSISIKDARKSRIKYDITDIHKNKINGCDHYFESAGESTWNLLGFRKNFIALSRFKIKRKELNNKLKVLNK